MDEIERAAIRSEGLTLMTPQWWPLSTVCAPSWPR